MSKKRILNRYLYSPWRLDYILSTKADDCIFCCSQDNNCDNKNYIVHRSKFSFVMLNLYPYNNGHVMVIPNRHVSTLTEIPEKELFDLISLIKKTEMILKKLYNCEGLNVGANIGKAAGAGVDQHIHFHMVPRWNGDCNFMTAIGGIRIIPEEFDKAFTKLKAAFANQN